MDSGFRINLLDQFNKDSTFALMDSGQRAISSFGKLVGTRVTISVSSWETVLMVGGELVRHKLVNVEIYFFHA